jgi:hypothetical protein
VDRPEAAETRRHTVTLPLKLSGKLAYYAQIRRMTESAVVAEALAARLKGLRISDGAEDAGDVAVE